MPTAVAATSEPVVAGAAAPGPSDEELVALLRGGSTSAGEVLVRRYHEPLLRYLQRLGGSDHAAEELHQQTWLSVLDHLDKFAPGPRRAPADAVASLPAATVPQITAGPASHNAPIGGGAFKAWLFRIATNKANDQWRSAGREKSAKQGLKLVTDESVPDASFRMDGTEQEARLRRAIAQLPEAQRQVLMLRYYSGLKFVEIAEMLGCPLNTALGRMHKAMIKLKVLMGE